MFEVLGTPRVPGVHALLEQCDVLVVRHRTNVWRGVASLARGVSATNKRPAARRNTPALPSWQEPRFAGWQIFPVFHRPFGGASRAEAEHELEPSRTGILFLFLLAVLAGLAAFVVYGLFGHRRKPLVVLEKRQAARRAPADRPARPTEEKASQPPSDFSRLSEGVRDLPPKEQARRLQEHFGKFGGTRPTRGPWTKEQSAMKAHSRLRAFLLPE